MAGRIAGTKDSASSRAVVLADGATSPDGAGSTATSFAKPSRRGTKGSKLSASTLASSKTGLSLGDQTNDDNSSSGKSTSSSDKFMVGVVGATLMILQVVVLISGLTTWLRVINTEKVNELKKILGDDYVE